MHFRIQNSTPNKISISAILKPRKRNKALGENGHNATKIEMMQLHKRELFQPIQESDLNDIEKY